MTNQESSQNKRIKFPVGLVNQIALALGVILLAITVSSLIAQLFFGHRLSFRQPEQSDIVLPILSLGFLIALFTVQHVRNNFRLLWSATLGFALISLIGKTAFYVSGNFIQVWEFFYSISSLTAAMLYCFALLKGERLDKFLVEAPISLVAKLMKVEIKN